jgi:hypothetical protein
MYILTQQSRFLAVPITVKYRTCILGFQTPEMASSIKLVRGVTHVKFKRQNLKTKFNTYDISDIKVSKVHINENFHKFVEINNFMIMMVDEYIHKNDILYLDGIMMDHDYSTPNIDYLEQLL